VKYAESQQGHNTEAGQRRDLTTADSKLKGMEHPSAVEAVIHTLWEDSSSPRPSAEHSALKPGQENHSQGKEGKGWTEEVIVRGISKRGESLTSNNPSASSPSQQPSQEEEKHLERTKQSWSGGLGRDR
jgi:hypothetical protein